MTNLNERVYAMTINEACTALSLGRSTVYKLIGDGTLKAIKIAGSTRIPTDSIRALMESAPNAALSAR